MQGSEIADFIREYRPVFGRCKGELVLVGGCILPGFLRREDIVTAATQIRGQAGHDMAVKIQANEEPFKARVVGHAPALPGQ